MASPTRLIVVQRPNQPLEFVCARLRGWGCELYACHGHGEAIAVLAEGAVDLVLIDAWVEHGMALLTAIKADPRGRSLPVVIAMPDDATAVAAHALALGADDILTLPVEDSDLYARIRALSRLAKMEIERRRRTAVLSEFGVVPAPEMPAVPAIDRVAILLIGPASGDKIQVMTALGGGVTAAHAETVESALERMRRDDFDVVLITTNRDHGELQRLCAEIRSDIELFDLPVVLIGRTESFPDRSLPFEWGISDVLFQPFRPEVLRLRVQGWVRQQRLRRRLRGWLEGDRLPPTTDRLTRLFGHGFLHAYLEQLIAENRHSQTPLALVSFDIAGMGQINRTCGYAAGDRALGQLGRTIARSARAEDLPARLGGDRFCLVIDAATATEAGVVGDRIAAILTEMPIEVGLSQPLYVALATGTAELMPDDDAAALVARAFAALQPFGLRHAS